MKRFFSILLCLSMILMMASCSGIKETKPSTEAFVVGFSQVGSESDWRVANTKSMAAAFENDDEYEFLMENARQEQENQFTAIRRFILEGVDFIVIAPTVEEGWDTILAEIRDANIPVIIIDRSVAVEDDSLYLTNIGSDFLQQGKLAVEWIENDTPSDKELKILHLQGTIGATAQIQRTKALEDAVRTHSNWKIVSQLYGDFTEAKAYEVMTIDLFRAKAKLFSVIDGKIMPSFTSIDGLGDNAADSIVEAAKKGPFLSKDDFKARAKVSQTITDEMADLGILGDIPESNQISLFDFM